MRKIGFLLFFSTLILYPLSAGAQLAENSPAPKLETGPNLRAPIDIDVGVASEQGQLYSPSVARKLHDTAYELASSKKAGWARIEQSIVLLKAAMKLDKGADYIYPTLIELACRDSHIDHSGLVRSLLAEYVDESANLEVAGKAVRYLLGRLNSREQREKIVVELLLTVGNQNVILGSELAAMLGILMAEKPDEEAAGFYFAQAYKNNKFNKTAFERLVEMFPDKLGPEFFVEHLRLALMQNPSNIDIPMQLGQYAERLELYEIAAAAYQYCADLFEYLYPSEPLAAQIYMPWAISSYNTERSQSTCLRIADFVRKSGRFDLLVEALAGKAAAKSGDGDRATRIFQAAREKADQLLTSGPGPSLPGAHQVTAMEFAWFYCFALPNAQEALKWANKANVIEPNSPSATGILAYALMMNGETAWAKPLVEKNKPTQISQLVSAQIQIAEDDKDSAKKTLKSVIAQDPGSLAAEKAKALLAELDSQYIPSIDPDVVHSLLEQGFGTPFIPAFTAPDKLFSVQFNIRGNKFPYGSEFGAVIAVINNSSEALVVSDDGLFRGGIRVDADVSGDLSIKIPELVSIRARAKLLIEPGKSILVPAKLVTGKLRRLLLMYPQASLDIEFTLYIDPVVKPDGTVANRLAKKEPTKLTVRRQGIELTSKYLRNRFRLIAQGQQGQKIKTAQLFVGLLMEQYAMSNRKPPYKFMYADWMPTMFKNALVHEAGLLRNPTNGEWVVKVHTMAEMAYLPMDHELAAAVAEGLNHPKWPVRMMSIFLLANTQEGRFDKVLEWAAKHDQQQIVREMATAMGAVIPPSETPQTPLELGEPVKTLSTGPQ